MFLLCEFWLFSDPSVAPALQAARAELEKSKLEDKLEHLLEHRPKQEDLIQHNIMKGSYQLVKKSLSNRPLNNFTFAYNAITGITFADPSVAPALQAAKAELEKSKLEDKLEHLLEHRPKQEQLIQHNIMKGN